MSTTIVNSHRRCTKLRESAPSQSDEEARKPRSSSKDQTISENGRRTDGRKRRSRRDGERRVRGHEEAGREEGRLEGDGRNKREEVKGRRNTAWWQKLLCCTDTAVTPPATNRIPTKSNADKKIRALNSDGSSTEEEQQPLHGTKNEGIQRSRPKRNVNICECRGPRNSTKDHGRQKDILDGSFARYPGFHDSSEDEGIRIPRPPQTEKPKKRRSNRRFSTQERKDTVTVPSEVLKRVEEKLQDNQNQSEKSNINIILQLPSKMFNTCCRSNKYLPVVPSCHGNLTQGELDYIKLCVSAEEAIGKPLPCSSNRKVYDYWLNKYGIALKGLLLSDSSDFETTDEEDEHHEKNKLTRVNNGKAQSKIDGDTKFTRVNSEKNDKLPPPGKSRSDGEKTEVTSTQIEEDHPPKNKRDSKQRIILTRQNVSQISICSESVSDEICEGQEKLQKKKDVKAETEQKATNQDDLVSSFLRSATGYLDRSSPDKGQTQRPECTECLKRSNFTHNIVCQSPISTKDTSTQTIERMHEEKSHKGEDKTMSTSSSPATSREPDITTRLLMLLEGQMSQRLLHQQSNEDISKRRHGRSAKNTVEQVSVETQANMKEEKSFTVMCPSSSNSEIEVFTTPTRHISDEEHPNTDSAILSKVGQTNTVSSKTSLREEKTETQTIKQKSRNLLDETERQDQVKLDIDVAMTTAQNTTVSTEGEDVLTVMAKSSASSSASDNVAEKPKRVIDTMAPPVLACRGFLGSSLNQKGKAMDISQGSLEALKPTQELFSPVTSGNLQSRQDFLSTQLPPLTVPSQSLSMTNDERRMGMGHQDRLMNHPGPTSHGITEKLVANDHQRHRQLTPIEVPATGESTNISAEGISPLAVGVLPPRRSLQLAPLAPLAGSASSTNSLHPSGNYDLGQPSRFGQLAPLSGAQEDNMAKKTKGKKKKKNKKKAQEKMTTSDLADQNTVRFPVQNVNVASENHFMSTHHQRGNDQPSLRPMHPLRAHAPPQHLLHPGRARLQPIARQPNLSDVRRKVSAPSAHQPLTGLRRGRKEHPNIARNVAMLRQKKNEPEKKGFLEPILPRDQLGPREELEQDHEMLYDPRVIPVQFHGVVPPELMGEYVEYPIPEELLYSEQLGHEHHFPGMSVHHGFPPREAYIDPRQMAHYQLAGGPSEMEDPGLVLVDDDELGLETVLALPPTRQKFWDSDFRC